jgi:hypothetical protein
LFRLEPRFGHTDYSADPWLSLMTAAFRAVLIEKGGVVRCYLLGSIPSGKSQLLQTGIPVGKSCAAPYRLPEPEWA